MARRRRRRRLDLQNSQQRDILYNDLYREVCSASSSTPLSDSLRRRIEEFDKWTRRSIVSRVRKGCSPLFIACKKGNVAMVEYLVSMCNANLEQRGLYAVQEDRSVHHVTPLWAASVAGKVDVLTLLLKHNADVNSMSDTGSTPLRSACYKTNLDIVKLLVHNNADIKKANYVGGTSLINSVQSVELCELLLRNGAEVNAQDIKGKTALHYAIQEKRLETTKLLLSFGADPFLESSLKDDALQTACLKGATKIFDYLTHKVDYSAERIASAFELLGSTFLDEHQESGRAIQSWRAACEVRETAGLTKQIQPPKKQFRYASEFTNREELEAFCLDLDDLRLQSLIICDRVLAAGHKTMIFRLIYRGIFYADNEQHQHCSSLWQYALELRIAKDTILHSDSYCTARSLVMLFLSWNDGHNGGVLAEDVLHTTELLLSDLGHCSLLLEVAPVLKSQQENWDKVLTIMSHLLFLVTQLAPAPLRQLPLRRKIHRLVSELDPRTTSRDSLLHLAVSESSSIFALAKPFPSVAVAEMLLECGARVHATNYLGSTPLHTASTVCNFKREVVDLLLRHGAHIDLKNDENVRASDLLAHNPASTVFITRFLSLKCLCAQVISRTQLSYKGEVVACLIPFIRDH